MTVRSRACPRPRPTEEPSEARLLVVDDHPGVREGLVAPLSLEDDLTVVGECEDGSETVAAAARARPDVVLVDGLTATRALMQAQPEPRVIVLTSRGAGAETAGARGLVRKGADPQALLRCIRAVAHDCTCCPRCLGDQRRRGRPQGRCGIRPPLGQHVVPSGGRVPSTR